VPEDDIALRVLQVFVQAHSGTALPQDAGQCRLAHLDRLTPQVRAIQLQQVESVGFRLVPAVAEKFPWKLKQLRTDQRTAVRYPRFSKHQRVLPLSARAPLPLSQNSARNSEATMKPAVNPDPVEEATIDLRGL